ncbi:MAG: prolipoprotein diacylglyceryl transferase [Tenericutes bacterium]|jgi:phosphatidylglycerol:prolipoprotein diacylglycerol transferase|nr:prolipoprotein diacylglyceryl transferase [Mycoplasmatota bacterium]
MNRVAFNLGFIEIYWYSLIILLGIIIANIYLLREGKKDKLDLVKLSDLIFYTIIFGLLGARIYYVLFNLDYYFKHPSEILAFRNGGLAIHGGIIFGTLFIIYYCHKHKKNVWQILDLIAPTLLIGQIIGRYGNFINQEAHGPITTLSFLNKFHLPTFIIKGMYINGSYYHPTFLYESFWNFIGLILILTIKSKVKNKQGFIVGFYLLWYSIGRFCIEILRTDSLMLGNVKIAMIVSIMLAVIGIIIMIKTWKRGKRNE